MIVISFIYLPSFLGRFTFYGLSDLCSGSLSLYGTHPRLGVRQNERLNDERRSTPTLHRFHLLRREAGFGHANELYPIVSCAARRASAMKTSNETMRREAGFGHANVPRQWLMWQYTDTIFCSFLLENTNEHTRPCRRRRHESWRSATPTTTRRSAATTTTTRRSATTTTTTRRSAPTTTTTTSPSSTSSFSPQYSRPVWSTRRWFIRWEDPSTTPGFRHFL
jgi:hypothetical protein